MTGPSMELYVDSVEEAQATVKTLLTSHLKFDQLHNWTDAGGQTHYSEQPPVPSPVPSTKQVPDARTMSLLKELQGSWDVIKATMNGKQGGDRALLEGHWKFQGNELVLAS